MQDVFVTEEEIAASIVNALRLKLDGPRRYTDNPQAVELYLRGRYAYDPVNPEAYDAYLKGSYESHKETGEALNKSVEYFEQAIQKDPTYAKAWAGLSFAYDMLSKTPDADWPTLVALAKAKHAALKALELDETLPEAHDTLGAVLMDLEWSWSAAEKEFERAIALDPNSARAHTNYGAELLAMGRLDEAIGELKRALRLDPVSPSAHFVLGMAFEAAARYDEALQEYRETATRGTRGWTPYRRMAGIYEQKGMQKEALDELLVVLRVRGEKELAALVEQKYLSSGYLEAKKIFLQGAVRRHAGPVWTAAAYAALGEKKKALEWLDKAFQMHAPGLYLVKVDHRIEFEALRTDARFLDLLSRMGLSP
jgi:adenylate cyclase